MTQPNQQSQPPMELSPLQVAQLHRQADIDVSPSAAHHTLGVSGTQASPGNHNHDGANSKKVYNPITVTGSRGGNAALTSLLSALATHGIITNNTTA